MRGVHVRKYMRVHERCALCEDPHVSALLLHCASINSWYCLGVRGFE